MRRSEFCKRRFLRWGDPSFVKGVFFSGGRFQKIRLYYSIIGLFLIACNIFLRGRGHISLLQESMVLLYLDWSILSCRSHRRPLVSTGVHWGWLLIFCGGDYNWNCGGCIFSPVNLAFDFSLIAFYDFIFVSCLSCLKVCPKESLPKSDDRNMFKFAFEIWKKNRKICARRIPYLDLG